MGLKRTEEWVIYSPWYLLFSDLCRFALRKKWCSNWSHNRRHYIEWHHGKLLNLACRSFKRTFQWHWPFSETLRIIASTSSGLSLMKEPPLNLASAPSPPQNRDIRQRLMEWRTIVGVQQGEKNGTGGNVLGRDFLRRFICTRLRRQAGIVTWMETSWNGSVRNKRISGWVQQPQSWSHSP